MAENGLQNGPTSNVGNYINNMGIYNIVIIISKPRKVNYFGLVHTIKLISWPS